MSYKTGQTATVKGFCAKKKKIFKNIEIHAHTHWSVIKTNQSQAVLPMLLLVNPRSEASGMVLSLEIFVNSSSIFPASSVMRFASLAPGGGRLRTTDKSVQTNGNKLIPHSIGSKPINNLEQKTNFSVRIVVVHEE